MTYDSLMIHNIYLQSSTSSQNSFGEWINTYTTASTAEECRVNPVSAEELIKLPGAYDDVKYKVYCKSGSTIDRGMKAVYESNTYKVREVLIDSSHHHKKAYLALI